MKSPAQAGLFLAGRSMFLYALLQSAMKSIRQIFLANKLFGSFKHADA